MGKLQEQACKLQELARQEEIAVWKDCIVRKTAKGEMKFGRGREGSRLHKVYLGSSRKMSRSEATQKAKETKREALGMRL